MIKKDIIFRQTKVWYLDFPISFTDSSITWTNALSEYWLNVELLQQRIFALTLFYFFEKYRNRLKTYSLDGPCENTTSLYEVLNSASRKLPKR